MGGLSGLTEHQIGFLGRECGEGLGEKLEEVSRGVIEVLGIIRGRGIRSWRTLITMNVWQGQGVDDKDLEKRNWLRARMSGC